MIEMDELQSDGIILGKTIRENMGNDLLLSIEMPWGEHVHASVKKLDVNAANNWCNIVRGAADERKAMQEAKASRQASRPSYGPTTVGEAAVPAPEAPVAVDFMSLSSVADRLRDVVASTVRCTAELKALNIEGEKLAKIMEVLNAFENDAEELRSISVQEGEVQVTGVDRKPRKAKS